MGGATVLGHQQRRRRGNEDYFGSYSLLLVICSFCCFSTTIGAPVLPSAPSPNDTRPPPPTVLPHCSKAYLTVSHTSRLTRRSVFSTSSQVSLNIGVGQSVCFRLQPLQQPPQQQQEQPLEMRRAPATATTTSSKPPSNSTTTTPTTPKPSTTITTTPPPSVLNMKRRRSRGAPANKNNTAPVATPIQTFSPPPLHILTLVELEQYYAVKERYRFAIPEVETNCICECNADSPTCQADQYKYGRCSSSSFGDDANDGSSEEGGAMPRQPSPPQTDDSTLSTPSVCHRTFFANQPSGSCPGALKKDSTARASRLCCQLRFRPWANRAFTAFRLEPTSTSAVLRYSLYQYKEGGKGINSTATNGGDGWVEEESRKIRVQLDGSLHNTVLDEQTGLKLSILGGGGGKSIASANQLTAGMYFVERLPNGQYGELIEQPLNRANEHDFHKLGWFRLGEGANSQPFVQSGDIFMDRIHHARAENCASQRYRSVLEASYYINQESNDTSRFELAEPLWRVQRWIKSARVYDGSERQAVVTASEGTNLEVTLTLPSEPPEQPQQTIFFVHNSSHVSDFAATILVDRFSNSLLNLTLFNAQGVLNGYVRRVEDWSGMDIDSFSVSVPPLSTSASTPVNVVARVKPYPVNSIQLVCLRPDDSDMTYEICRPVQSLQYELEANTMRNEWLEGRGSCRNCNAISVDGFMRYLNPANWVKGVNSVSDAVMLVSDICGYVFVLVVLYILVVKIALPIVHCCLCPMSIFYSKGKGRK